MRRRRAGRNPRGVRVIGPTGTFATNVMEFGRLLRRAGLPVGPADMLAAVTALDHTGVTSRDDVRTALRATMIHRHEQAEVFDSAFALFWRDPAAGEFEAAMALLGEKAPKQDPRPAPGSRRVAEAFNDRKQQRPSEAAPALDAVLTVSESERLQQMDFEAMSAAEIAAARTEIARLRLPLDLRPTRRTRPAARGSRIDMAATLRAGLRQGGELVDLARAERVVRPPPLVVLCDISGSMGRYAQVLLHFLHAVANDRDRVSVFLFGTRLTNVTPPAAPPRSGGGVPGGGQPGARLVRRHPHRRDRGAVQPALGQARAGPGCRGAAGHRRAGPRRRGRAGGGDGAAAQILPPADLAQSAVALGRLRTEITGHPRDAAACRRVPARPQPRQPARADNGAVPPEPGARPPSGAIAMTTNAEDILTVAAAWRRGGERVALATVTQTWGSSPRPAGSQMAVTAGGRMAGSVSGGCVEGAVADAAQSTLAGGPPQLLEFGISDERAWEVGLACGGKLTVFVEAVA